MIRIVFRVVRKNESKAIEGMEFQGWGSSCSSYPLSYLNVAGAVGMTKHDVDTVIERLDTTIAELKKRAKKKV